METQAAMLALQLLVKYGPEVAQAFVNMFKGGSITIDQVEVFIAKVKDMDFWAISGLPKPAPVVPVVLP